MLRFLFPRLTPRNERGSALFAALVAEARRPAWFVERAVPDTIDGRFAVLASLIALTNLRLERGGHDGVAASVALAERFVETMDAEHRQLGLGDPTLGKTVRKLMGSLARRVELWRGVIDHQRGDWTAATRESLYRGGDVAPAPLAAGEQALRDFAARVDAAPVAAMAEGKLG